MIEPSESSSRLHRRERIETFHIPRQAWWSLVPPGFIAGSGLKREFEPQDSPGPARSSRLHRRERIETEDFHRINRRRFVPPGFIAGSGLKLDLVRSGQVRIGVPPGFIAGSGLKRDERWLVLLLSPRSSRLHRRERIETERDGRDPRARQVPPGFIAGSGLKQAAPAAGADPAGVPPGFIAGSGLKLRGRRQSHRARLGSSRLHRRERIETDKSGLPSTMF